MTKIKCLNCGHSWLPRVETPKACPACKIYLHLVPEPDTTAGARAKPDTHKKHGGRA